MKTVLGTTFITYNGLAIESSPATFKCLHRHSVVILLLKRGARADSLDTDGRVRTAFILSLT